MKLNKQLSFGLLFFLISLSIFANKPIQLSPQAEISVMTCEPGSNELHSVFGHSCMRVIDVDNNIDFIYNYGTFNFDTPNFHTKFIRGKLLYRVVKFPYKYFPYTYQRQNRWVKEQIIDLSPNQKQEIYNFLEWNALPENREYAYDGFFDNCAIKMYEILERTLDIKYDFSTFPQDKTHRKLMHDYTKRNNWYQFGLDLALGTNIDYIADQKEYLYLPDYIYGAFEHATVNGKPLVKETKYILPKVEKESKKTSFFTSPLFFSITMLLLIVFAFYKRINWLLSTTSILYGLLGLFIFFLWFFTDHYTTKWNFNILWAHPLFLIYPFIKNTAWKKWIGIISFIAFIIIGISNKQLFDPGYYLLALGGLFIGFKRD